MSIKILDLNYCQALTENNISMNGGRTGTAFVPQRPILFELCPNKLANESSLNEFDRVEIDTNSDSIITRLSDTPKNI